MVFKLEVSDGKESSTPSPDTDDTVEITVIENSPPMDGGPVQVKKNRALPLKAELFDSEGVVVTDADIDPPVVQVIYEAGTQASEDVTEQAVPVGLATEGNQFVFEDGKWRYNLKTKPFSATGTYTITMVPGDSYVIQPTCTAQFVIE